MRILLTIISIILALLTAGARTGPDEAISNLSKWVTRLHLPQWMRSRTFTKAIATTGPFVLTLCFVYLVFLEFWPHPSALTPSAAPTKILEIEKWMDVPAAIEAFVPVALKKAYDQSVKHATHLQEEIEAAQSELVAPSGFPVAQGKAAEDLRYQILEYRNELAIDAKQQEQAQNAVILCFINLFKSGDLFARGYDQKTDKWVYVLPNEWEYLQLVPRTGALTEDSMAIIGGLAGRTNLAGCGKSRLRGKEKQDIEVLIAYVCILIVPRKPMRDFFRSLLVWIQFGKPVAHAMQSGLDRELGEVS
jgi:hypothetical protein